MVARLGILLATLMLASSAAAIDYRSIDRTIGKEPDYQSKSPQYALLVFGPEAKLRVWVVIDGETLYVDRNSDGDLTGVDERFEKLSDCKDVELADPDGKTRYVITHARTFPYEDDNKQPAVSLMVDVDIKGPVEYQQYSDARMSKSAAQAGIAHFHGPLKIGPSTRYGKIPSWVMLQTGDKPRRLDAIVGTIDVENNCWVVVRSMTEGKDEPERAFPDKFPMVEIEFPPKSPGGSSVVRRYPLTKFCCQAIFKDDISAPEEAGVGNAKVTFSFEAWKEGHVMPSTAEIPVYTAERAADVIREADRDK